MSRQPDVRQGRVVLLPLVLWVMLAVTAAGCSQEPSTSNQAGTGAAASSVTPAAFRNLGKRAESPL